MVNNTGSHSRLQKMRERRGESCSGGLNWVTSYIVVLTSRESCLEVVYFWLRWVSVGGWGEKRVEKMSSVELVYILSCLVESDSL